MAREKISATVAVEQAFDTLTDCADRCGDVLDRIRAAESVMQRCARIIDQYAALGTAPPEWLNTEHRLAVDAYVEAANDAYELGQRADELRSRLDAVQQAFKRKKR